MAIPVIKTCAYCKQTFTDDTSNHRMRFCSEGCRRRAKLERLGQVSEGGFLADREQVCPTCSNSFIPKKGNQEFCSVACRKSRDSNEVLASRNKTCCHCGAPFTDSSLKNNQRAHPECSARSWGAKDGTRELTHSPRTEEARRNQVRHGDGGRIDQLNTVPKYSHSWWGRVAELVFAAYRPKAKDVNALHGNTSPYDFEDLVLGRVDVRGAQSRKTPEGRVAWSFVLSGLQDSCNHAFLVGFSEEGTRLEYLWLIPSSNLNGSLIRLAPGSREYRGDQWDVSRTWGLMLGSEVLQDCHALEELPKNSDRFSWMDNEAELVGDAPGKCGRRGELLYRKRYPDSKDMNRLNGSMSPYDFEDVDGAKVNVKAARQTQKPEGFTFKWSFTQGPRVPVMQPDIYSCLCLDEKGVEVLREYRIPSSAWKGRTIHIYQSSGQWDTWLVKSES